MPFVTAVLTANPLLVSDAPHMDAFSVKDFVNIESFLFDCPIDDGRFSVKPLVLFQVLEKTL